MFENIRLKLKGWRMLLFNGLSGSALVVGEIVQDLQFFDWYSILSPQWAVRAILVVNIVNIALRFVTTTPVGGASEPPTPSYYGGVGPQQAMGPGSPRGES